MKFAAIASKKARFARLAIALLSLFFAAHATAHTTAHAANATGQAGRKDNPAETPNRCSITVDPTRNRLTLYCRGKELKQYPIALGKPETPSPIGDFIIINKYKNWGSGFGTRWMGLNVPWGIYGIHGTNKPHLIGGDVSGGCIRMRNADVEELYEYIGIGTKVSILGHVLGEPWHDPRRMAKGDSGSTVQIIQSRLKSAGYFHGPINGKFGPQTEQALKAFEAAENLPVDGVISLHDYIRMGLVE
ncbi:MAG TPA: L,D-transpeptidase family protein [Bacilli bacterium]